MAQVVFAWAKDVSSQQQLEEAVSGAEVRLFSNELSMLQAWLAFFMEADPDALILFQVCTPAMHRISPANFAQNFVLR